MFRAIAAPTKGRVEIEGLTNILGGLKESKQKKIRLARYDNDASSAINMDGSLNNNDPISFILVSTSPNALNNFETPFGEFNGLKRQGESIVRNDFPSLSHAILQLGKFDDNFVEESLDILYEKDNNIGTQVEDESDDEKYQKSRRKVNRRDAARAVVDALLDESLEGKVSEVWTALRG